VLQRLDLTVYGRQICCSDHIFEHLDWYSLFWMALED